MSALLLASSLGGGAQVSDTGNQEPNPPAEFDSHPAGTGLATEESVAPVNRLGLPFLKDVVSDQRQFWSAPKELRHPAALKKFLPFAALTGALIAGDHSLADQVPAGQVQRSRDISNFATFALAGGAAGLYSFGRFARNEHLRETGLLSGEAALNTSLITFLLQRSTLRQDPSQGNGKFFERGNAFPSAHAALAWSIATVTAHEYPGPLTRIFAYGLATTVTATRVTGKKHFPSDVLVGSALGWYLGRQVYRSRHDPELGGDSWDGVQNNAATEENSRPPGKMGSPYVPLDSWVYPAIEKLAALGYIQTAFLGLKPWTRIECAQLIEQAGDAISSMDDAEHDVAELQSHLQAEFAYEFGILSGAQERNRTFALESVYARGVSVSGPPLTDSDHFGQTLSYDFGRPLRRGMNAQLGGALRAAAGPAAVYVRAEFQHAPAAPALSEAVRNFIASSDLVPAPAASAFSSIHRARLLDASVALNLKEGWQLSFGQQSLSWAPGPGGSFLWSNNIEPIPMFRLTQSDMRLPSLLKVLGPIRVDSFFGRLPGHTFIPKPYVYGNKINFKPLPNLELGFGRTVTIGGKGGNPLTAKNLLLSFFGQTSTQLGSVPGDSNSSFDWTFYVPKLRNYLVFYGDLYADDDFLPFQNPPKNPFRPGIYLTRFPRLRKLDFHLEAASTESPWFPKPWNLNYWNSVYRDGYTSNGNLIGNTVGRMGRSIQCWFNYWMSSRHTLQFTYKHNTVSKDFVPKGGSWQDYGFQHQLQMHSSLYVKSQLQYEHISRYPILFQGPQRNIVAIIEVGLVPNHFN